MENKEKLRILLQHWIDHNIGHAEEFEKWRHTADHDGEKDIAASIGEAIVKMKEANAALEKAMEHAGGKPETKGDHHHHHHHHHH